MRLFLTELKRFMNKNEILDRCATYVWPLLRNFVNLSKRCSNCIVSEKYTRLDNGICQECIDYNAAGRHSAGASNIPTDMKERFDTLLNKPSIKGKYDALLLLSGGKDSAYILYRLRNEYPNLRILCLLVNNGFMSHTATPAARHIAEKTKTDLMLANSYIDEFAQALREAFLRLKGGGSYGIVDYTDGDLIFKVGKKIAADMDIPIVIGGLSWVQAEKILGSTDFVIKEEGLPDLILPLVVWRTDEQEIGRFVRANGLLPKGSDSPVVSNSQLIMTMCAADVLNLGYCSFELEFAQLVREGKSERKVWLHRFELLEFATKSGNLRKDMEDTLKKMNLSLSDIIKSGSL